MKTSLFTKIINSEKLFIFEFRGDCSTPYGNGRPIKQGVLTKKGFSEEKINVPEGKYTKVENLDFDSAMKKSQDNVKNLSIKWEEKAKIEKAKEEKLRKERFNIAMEKAMSTGKGWYSVNVRALVMKYKGNDGWIDQSVRVLADNGYDAYNKAVDFIQDPKNFQGNTMLVQYVDDFETAYIDYIGILTDEYLNENGEF